MKWNNKSYALLALGIGILSVAILIWTRPQKQPQLLSLPVARVQVAKLEAVVWNPSIQRIGRFEPRRRSQLHFEVSGVVSSLPVEVGTVVQAGDVLIVLDDADYRDLVREARSNLELEQAGVERDRKLLKLAEENRLLQQGEVGRLKKLNKQSLVSQTVLDSARQNLSQLNAERERLQYSMDSAGSRVALKQVVLDRAQRNLDRTQLRAPYNGVVNRIEVEVGDRAEITASVMEVVDLDELELYVQVRSATARYLKAGQVVDIQIRQEQSIEGTIISVQRDPDAGMSSHAVRIRVPASMAESGQLATVIFRLPEVQDALLVPTSAVLHEQGSSYLMVVKDNRLHKRLIQTGDITQDNVLIRKGMSVGEYFVSRDVAVLQDDQQVTAVQTETASDQVSE